MKYDKHKYDGGYQVVDTCNKVEGIGDRRHY